MTEEVEPETPAGKGGLKAGDTITKFNGETVKTVKKSARTDQGEEARRHGQNDRSPRHDDW